MQTSLRNAFALEQLNSLTIHDCTFFWALVHAFRSAGATNLKVLEVTIDECHIENIGKCNNSILHACEKKERPHNEPMLTRNSA